jgi:hypothetical protein
MARITDDVANLMALHPEVAYAIGDEYFDVYDNEDDGLVAAFNDGREILMTEITVEDVIVEVYTTEVPLADWLDMMKGINK